MRCQASYLVLILLSISLPQILLTQTSLGSQEKFNAELLEAAKDGQAEKVLDLIKTGADVNAKDASGDTALILAAYNGRIETVKALIKSKADVNAKGSHGYTALMVAAYNGDTEMVKALIEARADVNAENKSGDTALILAMRQNYKGIVDLLKSAGAKSPDSY